MFDFIFQKIQSLLINYFVAQLEIISMRVKEKI